VDQQQSTFKQLWNGIRFNPVPGLPDVPSVQTACCSAPTPEWLWFRLNLFDERRPLRWNASLQQWRDLTGRWRMRCDGSTWQSQDADDPIWVDVTSATLTCSPFSATFPLFAGNLIVDTTPNPGIATACCSRKVDTVVYRRVNSGAWLNMVYNGSFQEWRIGFPAFRLRCNGSTWEYRADSVGTWQAANSSSCTPRLELVFNNYGPTNQLVEIREG